MKTIQITAGKGPAECCWVVAQVLKQLIQDIKKENIKYTLLQRELGIENGTLKSATLQLQGKELGLFLKGWLGTVQWIGKSSFRKQHKRNNWFIGIYEINTKERTELNEKDIKFQAIRSSGSGGQHVNKVSSAIRATDTLSGIQVVAMDSRSQHQNKKIAIKRLQEKVNHYNQEQLKLSVQHQWENHLSLERGNPVRVFSGTEFKKQNVDKKYTSKRQQIKKNLRQQKWD